MDVLIMSIFPSSTMVMSLGCSFFACLLPGAEWAVVSSAASKQQHFPECSHLKWMRPDKLVRMGSAEVKGLEVVMEMGYDSID